MSRYIDADALKANINTAFWSEIEKIIDSAPSIDIVRCKDCKKHNTHRCHMAYDFISTDDDDYCSYGKERP